LTKSRSALAAEPLPIAATPAAQNAGFETEHSLEYVRDFDIWHGLPRHRTRDIPALAM